MQRRTCFLLDFREIVPAYGWNDWRIRPVARVELDLLILGGIAIYLTNRSTSNTAVHIASTANESRSLLSMVFQVFRIIVVCLRVPSVLQPTSAHNG
jgi:hypothetical protein